MHFWIRGLLGAALLAAPLAQATAAPAPTPAPAAAQPGSLPQLGETWVLRGHSDRGVALEQRLTLRPLSDEVRREFEEGVQKANGAALGKIQAIFGAVTSPGGGEGMVTVFRLSDDVQLVQVAPGLGDVDAPFLMCFLAPRSAEFSGISLRLRDEGESYSSSGVTPLTASGPLTALDVVRAIGQSMTPLFGIGDCRLSRD